MTKKQPKFVRSLADGESGEGAVNQIQRVGHTVHRTGGPWSDTLHRLLEHLKHRGFHEAPESYGFTDDGKEIVRYIQGETAQRPWPAVLIDDKGLLDIIDLVKRYHAAVADFDPGPDAQWRHGQQPLREGEIVRHGDLGPWNFVFREDELMGLIDWDLATPGTVEEDIAQLAYLAVPLSLGLDYQNAGIESESALRHRLDVFCVAFNVTPEKLHNQIIQRIRNEHEKDERLALAGIYPWTEFFANGRSLEEELSDFHAIFARLV